MFSICIFICILIVLIIIILYTIKWYKHKYHNNNYVIELYQMLKDTTKLLENNNIIFWMSGGTLLGAIRHKGLIPWDDDADIEIDEKDIQKLLSLEKIFNNYGYKITKVDFGFKISLINNKNIDGYDYSFPFIDIFITKNVNGIMKFVNEKTQLEFQKCNFNIKDLFPLKKYDFGIFQMYGANNPNNYLNSCYGDDWKTMMYKTYDHENEMGILDIRKVKITNYDHAKPTGPLK